MKKLPLSFYRREDVLQIAVELLGQVLVTSVNGKLTAGRIVETEAYKAFTDRASHAFGGRRTSRNEDMYGPGGTSYVYLCYGMHHMMNVVTNRRDVPEAVLIRALEPLEGIDLMLKRTGKSEGDKTLTRGPGNLTKALGITGVHSGAVLTAGPAICIVEGKGPLQTDIGVSRRIGVDYAGKDALLPYRFYIRGNPFLSGPGKINQ
jgi:DNA-3-methyladenine glycosylase